MKASLGLAGVMLFYLLSACEREVILEPRLHSGPIISPENINIFVRADGAIFWGTIEITRDELVRRLAVEAPKLPQPEVHIKADPRTKFKDFHPVLKDVQDAGFLKIGILGGVSKT